MKKIFLIFNFAFLILNFSLAQPAIQWQKCLGGTSIDKANSIQQTNDGGYIVTGTSSSNDGDVTGNHGGGDYWVVKLDGSGNLQWQKCLGGTNGEGAYGEGAYSIHQTSDGGYIAAGTTSSNDGDVTGNHGGGDYWVVKLDGSGNIQWQKCFGGTSDDKAYSVQQTADGGYVVGGITASSDGDTWGASHGGEDYWVIKLDGNGNLQWSRCYGGTSAERAYCLQLTSDGGYVLVGDAWSTDGDVTGNHGGDYWVVKLNSSGIIQWQKCFGGTNGDFGKTIKQTSDGGFIVAGDANSNDGDVTGHHGWNDIWVLRLDSSGNLEWQKCLGGIQDEYTGSIIQTTDGSFIVSGTTYSTNNGDVSGNHGPADYWVVKLNSSGVLQWQKCLGGTGVEGSKSIQQTFDGGYIIAGTATSINGDVTGNHGSNDYWIVKLAPILGIQEENTNINFNVSPNPFTTHATIKFSKEITAGTLRLYNMFGQVVLEKNNINGTETVINAENLDSGVYVYEVIEKAKRVYSGKAVVY